MTNVYFIGIGGIGMSAIARYYNNLGYKVSGYDRTPSRLTDALVSEGIDIHFTPDCSAIPDDVASTLVIYTPAVSENMEEMVYVREKGYEIVKRSKALGKISSNEFTLAVAGTHGKTSTSTMIAHIFTQAGNGCNAFLGGISKNYHTNLLLSRSRTLVAEADEFDRSFLQLYPDVAVITATDADHLDIYGTHEKVLEAYAEFASQVKNTGHLIVKKGVRLDKGNVGARIWSYAVDGPADFHAENLRLRDGGYYEFTFRHPAGEIQGCTLGVPGIIQVENGIAAAAAAILGGISPAKAWEALASFRGAERRLDVHVNRADKVYIDDYAHHPAEIASALQSIRNMFPGRKVCAVFQPHLFTRTRDFAEDFAHSLSLADSVILLGIYPAREEPIPGVTSELIFNRISCQDKVLIDKEELLDLLKTKDTDVLVTLGAGDIDRYIDKITALIQA